MTKHTPAPWAVEPDYDDIDGTVLIHGAADCPGLTPVALVYTADAFPCVEDEDRAAFEAECKANAALIAAAPDLLAACEATLDLMTEYGGCCAIGRGIDLRDVCRSAIAKARATNAAQPEASQ